MEFSHARAVSDKLGVAGKFDGLIEYLLGGLLLFMPLTGGARGAWSEEVVILLSGCIVICFLLKLIVDREQGLVWSWVYVPIGLFILVVTFQLLPMPADVIGAISPNTVRLRTELLSVVPGSEALLSEMPLSLYPYATAHDLRLVLSVASVFFVVVNVYRSAAQIKRLLKTVALIGGVVAIIALAQDLFGNGLIYWHLPNPHSKALSGAFINHNHFGQFMNLSIGAAIAWVCVTVHERFSGKTVKPTDVLDYLGSQQMRMVWVMITIMALAAVVGFVSLTRGGMVSMLAAGVVTTVLLVSRRSLAGRGWIMVVTAMLAFAAILLVGFDAVYDRFATLRNLDGYNYRLQTIKDLQAAFMDFPLLGTGFGTHAVVYPMYQSINSKLVFTHVENEYVQVLEEMGFVGLMLLIVVGAIVLASYVRSIRSARLPIRSAAYGIGFGLMAILIHSISDYGQHVPTNVFLSAIFCGLLVRLSKSSKAEFAVVRASMRARRVVGAALLAGVCGIWSWSMVGANDARLGEDQWKQALSLEERLAERNWQGEQDEYKQLIQYADAAGDRDSGHKQYRYARNLYRWYAVTKSGGQVDAGQIPEQSREALRKVVRGLDGAIIACPTYGPSYSLAGQIEMFVFNEQSGAEKIRRGHLLAPCDPIACLAAGRLDILQGKSDESVPKFEKALEIDSGLFNEIVDIYVNGLSRPNMAIEAAGDNIGRLRYVGRVLDGLQYYDLAEQCMQKSRKLLEQRCENEGGRAVDFALLAQVYRDEHELDRAIECYQQALQLNYGQVRWRYDLAKLLAAVDRSPEALDEARICVRLRPQFTEAKNLVGELLLDNNVERLN